MVSNTVFYMNNIHFDKGMASTGSGVNIDADGSGIGGGNNNNMQSFTNHIIMNNTTKQKMIAFNGRREFLTFDINVTTTNPNAMRSRLGLGLNGCNLNRNLNLQNEHCRKIEYLGG